MSNFSILPFPNDFLEYLESVAVSMEDCQINDDLLSKCLEECSGSEEALCYSRDGSRLVESIFGKSPKFSLVFLKRIGCLKQRNILRILCNRCGSRVIETLLFSVLPLLITEEYGCYAECLEHINEWVSLVCENWTKVTGDISGSHVVRCLGRICSGIGKRESSTVPTKKFKSAPGATPLSCSVSQTSEMKSIFQVLAGRILDWKLMSDYMHLESVSLLMQEFIDLNTRNKETFLKRFLEGCFDNVSSDVVVSMCCDKQASRVWEKIINCCTEDESERIYRLFLQGRLCELAKNPIGNFVVQRLVDAAKSGEMVTDLLEELETHLNEIIERKFYGVVIALVTATVRVPESCTSRSLVKVLMKAFQCFSPKIHRKWFLPCVLCLQNLSSFRSQSECVEDDVLRFEVENIELQGSLLVQKLLEIKSRKQLVKGFLLLDIDTFCGMACHKNGSHVVEHFLRNDRLSQEEKHYILQKMQGNWTRLAIDKYGSRILDTVWQNVRMKEKCSLAQELSAHSKKLTHSKFGLIVQKKYGLEIYKKSVKEWRNSIASSERKRKMLEDLIK